MTILVLAHNSDKSRRVQWPIITFGYHDWYWHRSNRCKTSQFQCLVVIYMTCLSFSLLSSLSLSLCMFRRFQLYWSLVLIKRHRCSIFNYKYVIIPLIIVLFSFIFDTFRLHLLFNIICIHIMYLFFFHSVCISAYVYIHLCICVCTTIEWKRHRHHRYHCSSVSLSASAYH